MPFTTLGLLCASCIAASPVTDISSTDSVLARADALLVPHLRGKSASSSSSASSPSSSAWDILQRTRAAQDALEATRVAKHECAVLTHGASIAAPRSRSGPQQAAQSIELGRTTSTTVAACCAACRANELCTAFVWESRDSGCWFKKGDAVDVVAGGEGIAGLMHGRAPLQRALFLSSKKRREIDTPVCSMFGLPFAAHANTLHDTTVNEGLWEEARRVNKRGDDLRSVQIRHLRAVMGSHAFIPFGAGQGPYGAFGEAKAWATFPFERCCGDSEGISMFVHKTGIVSETMRGMKLEQCKDSPWKQCTRAGKWDFDLSIRWLGTDGFDSAFGRAHKCRAAASRLPLTDSTWSASAAGVCGPTADLRDDPVLPDLLPLFDHFPLTFQGKLAWSAEFTLATTMKAATAAAKCDALSSSVFTGIELLSSTDIDSESAAGDGGAFFTYTRQGAMVHRFSATECCTACVDNVLCTAFVHKADSSSHSPDAMQDRAQNVGWSDQDLGECFLKQGVPKRNHWPQGFAGLSAGILTARATHAADAGRSARYVAHADGACLQMYESNPMEVHGKEHTAKYGNSIAAVTEWLHRTPAWEAGKGKIVGQCFVDYHWGEQFCDEMDSHIPGCDASRVAGFETEEAMVHKSDVHCRAYRPFFDIVMPLPVGWRWTLAKPHALGIKLRKELLGPNAHLTKRGILLFFKGTNAKVGVRRELIKLHDPAAKIVMLDATKGGAGEAEAKTYDYGASIANARFCAAPRGVGLDSYRLVEVMQFGCIPVIISNGYVPPFASALDWQLFSLSLAEPDIKTLPTILGAMPDAKRLRMAQHVAFVFDQFLSSRQRAAAMALTLMERNVRRAAAGRGACVAGKNGLY